MGSAGIGYRVGSGRVRVEESGTFFFFLISLLSTLPFFIVVRILYHYSLLVIYLHVR